MGSVIGGVVGAAGSLIGGQQKQASAQQAAQQSLAGFNFLTQGGGQNLLYPAINNATTASNAQGTIQGEESALLGGGTPAAQAAQKSAYDNYLNSTGYQFQLGQGQQAITGSAAASGLLNSGNTAKALTQYGQGLAAQGFNNYLGQLGNTNAQAATTASQGLSAAQLIGQAGTTGGGNAAAQIAAGGTAADNATATAGSVLGGAANSAYNNFFGNV